MYGAKLASLGIERDIAPSQLRQALERIAPAGSSEKSAKTVLNVLRSDPNNIYVFASLPSSVPLTIHSLQGRQLDFLALTALASKIGIPETRWSEVETHERWRQNANEARRILASPDFLKNAEVQKLLRYSFDQTHLDYFSKLPENQKVRDELRGLGVAHSIWLSEGTPQTYDKEVGRIPRLRREAVLQLHQHFYSVVKRAVDETRFDKDREKILKNFARIIAPNLKQLARSGKPFETVADAVQFVNDGFNRVSQRENRIALGRFEVQEGALNEFLLYLIGHLQRQMRTDVRRSTHPVLAELEAEAVNLQRNLAPVDPRISLLPSEKPHSLHPVRYKIFKPQKDPIHFFTGGNDSGVCDSTTDTRADLRPALLKKYGMQEAEIHRVNRDGTTKRIGQIRMYAAKDAENRPVLLVNSIDLEREERNNLFLYKRAIEYAERFRRQSHFYRLLLGQHADQHIMTYSTHPEFLDTLFPTEERVTLIDHGPSSERFSDFFGPGNIHDKEGVIKVYEVNLTPRRFARSFGGVHLPFLPYIHSRAPLAEDRGGVPFTTVEEKTRARKPRQPRLPFEK